MQKVVEHNNEKNRSKGVALVPCCIIKQSGFFSGPIEYSQFPHIVTLTQQQLVKVEVEVCQTLLTCLHVQDFPPLYYRLDLILQENNDSNSVVVFPVAGLMEER